MNIAAIWKAIQMLSAVMGLIKGLIQLVREFQENQSKRSAEKANQQMEQAKTAEEVQRANEAVTRNLP